MDIKDFSKTTLHNEQSDKQSLKGVDLEKINSEYGDLVQEFMKRYGKMSEKQMLKEMFDLIQKKKREGTFDAQKIKEAANMVAPFLDEKQKEYMFNLLNYIK
ncbi:MAG: hypothetical protein IJ837_00865 [Clostridia bacterium]|nr:hypothetical protein [Clostridia bacterium]